MVVYFGCVGKGGYIFMGKWGLMDVYFGWVGVNGHFLWVGGDEWRWVEVYFGWVGMSGYFFVSGW